MSVAPRLCHILVEDPDLADAIPEVRRDEAIEDCTAPEFSLPTGPWPLPPAVDSDGIGFLVLRGMLIRRVGIEGRAGVELVGECDVLRPWQGDDAQTLPLEFDWVVLEPARLAILDGSFTRLLGRHPELGNRLFERAVRRSRRLALNVAILHQARVDNRLHILFWSLAGRWGRVRGDGVLLPLHLTHNVLADLVAARRPTVTTALSDLSRRGLIKSVDEGWLLAGERPRHMQSIDSPEGPGGSPDESS